MTEIRYSISGTVGRLEGEELWPAYDEVFGDQPDRETWLSQTWDKHRARAGFRVCRALSGHEIVGFAWGYTGRAGQWWTDAVSAKLDPVIVRDWVGGHFEVVSIGVVPAARRRGVGREVLRRILAGAIGDRALLQTTSDPMDPARCLYASEGWHLLGPGATEDAVVLGRRRAAASLDGPSD